MSTVDQSRRFFLATAILIIWGLQSFAGSAQEPAVILAAGDVALCEKTRFAKVLFRFFGIRFDLGSWSTAALLDKHAGTILALGDLAYPQGTAEQFRNCYGPAWGRHRARTFPVPGNHDYDGDDASAYFTYFGDRAGEAGRGYYSIKLGSWHLVALNSNIDATEGSPQLGWLRRDLEMTPAHCILAFWHHAPFSSQYGRDERMSAALGVLHEAGASVVLTGHGHQYERFAPQDARGRLDQDRGIRAFVVGTGGADLVPKRIPQPNSEVFHADSWGVLKMILLDGRYEWEFVPAAATTFEDRGASACVARRR